MQSADHPTWHHPMYHPGVCPTLPAIRVVWAPRTPLADSHYSGTPVPRMLVVPAAESQEWRPGEGAVQMLLAGIQEQHTLLCERQCDADSGIPGGSRQGQWVDSDLWSTETLRYFIKPALVDSVIYICIIACHD